MLNGKELSVVKKALLLIECNGCPYETNEEECNENTMCEKICKILGKQELNDKQREVIARQLCYYEANNCDECPLTNECEKWEGKPICVAISEKVALYSWDQECFYPFHVELNCHDCKLAIDGKCNDKCASGTDGESWIPDFEGAEKYVEDDYNYTR